MRVQNRCILVSCVMIALAALQAAAVLRAEASTVNGRAYFTYQSVKGTRLDNEYMAQNLEATIRDRLFEKSNLVLSLYFDNNQNIRKDLTTRRYYGTLDLSGLYYNFSIHYSPKQKITPLEVESSRELTDQQLSLDLTVPSLPRLRLYYAKRSLFTEGVFAGTTRSMRADMSYNYKYIDIDLNRWVDKSTNTTENKTTVTGARFRFTKSLYRAMSVNTGYEYVLTANTKKPGARQDVSNHTVTALASSRYRDYITGSISMVSRWLNTDNTIDTKSTDNTYSFHLNFLPKSPLRLDLARNYIQSRQDTLETISDYATAQLVLSGKVNAKTSARAQFARRFIIESSRGAIPANIYLVSITSKIFKGINARADLNVSQRDVKEQVKGRYQTNSSLEIQAKPRSNLQLRTNVLFYKYSPRFSLLKNDRATYNLTATYFPARSFHIGVDAQRSLITSGKEQTNNSLTINSSITWRNRSNFNISYSLNAVEIPGVEPDSNQNKIRNNRSTLSIQNQLWLAGSGVLSVNYSRQEGEIGPATRFLTFSYRQNY